MLKKIRLFLRGIEADLPQAPDILFNYTEDDLRNPTIVKNSYTKTINLDDTPTNNKIFSGFWNNQFVVGSEFNPTKKMPFALYLNGDMIEEGYARLDSVTGGVNSCKYQITLFGGLGDFFYSLMYSEDDEGGKKSLADLHYISGSTSADEFDFTINMGAVKDAWKAMTLSESQATGSMQKWKYINFMPAYEGLPEDFDSDKVLVNFKNSDLVSGITSDDSGYTAFNGYALGELSREHTGNEMREFRSYLQRPVVKVNKVIEACCNPANNGGYEVVLDSTFFNDNNPYWTDTWATLSMLKSFETVPDEITGTTLSLSAATYGGIYRPERFYWQEHALVTGGTALSSDNMYAVQASFTLEWKKVKQAFANLTSTYPLHFCMYTDDYCYQASCMIMQLVAYNSGGQIVAGGKAVNLTSAFGHGGIDYPTPDNMNFVLPWGKEYTNDIGTWEGGYNRTYSNTISLSIDNVPAGATVKLVMRKYNLIGPDVDGNQLNICLGGQRVDTSAYTNDLLYYSWLTPEYEPIVVTMTHYDIEVMNSDIVRSGSHFKKANILSTSYSPADFLLSYGKMFGLYFSKDRYEKKIYIRTRDTYYLSDTIEEINNKIDRDKMNIKPVFVGTKWLDFNTETEESEDMEKYKESFGIDYGLQRVNTGYDFNADITNLFKDSVFKGGIPALEKSECYSYFDDDKYKPWMLEGYSYDLYLSGNTSNTTAVTYGEQTTIGVLQGFHGSVLKYYDLYESLQFHDVDDSPIDGANVLVFYNGNLNVENAVPGFDYGLKYWITDDNSTMMVLNDGKPCWLWTVTNKDINNDNIAVLVSQNNTAGIPLYSRYKYYNGTNNIAKSLDFGTPKQLFNPLASIDSGSSLYAQYWENFVKDLYSADTRVVTTKTPLPDNFSEEDMRKFYHFDGNIWRLNAVSEHNISNYEPTKVEFVKVQNTDNYQLNVDYNLDWFEMSSPKSLDNYYVIPYNNSQEIPVEIKPKSSDVSYNLSLKVNNQTIADYGSFTGTTNLDISSSLTNVTTDFLIVATADNNASNSLNFHKNGMKVTTIVDGDTIPASGNARLKIWVWFEDSATHGDQWRAETNHSVFWTKSNGTSTQGGIDLSTDYCEADVPANNTGKEIKWVFTIHMQSSSGDMTIVTFTQPSM